MINIEKDVERQFQKVLEDYLDSYFQERDLSRVADYLADSFYGCGTGLDELIFNKKDALAVFERDLKTVTQPIKVIYQEKEMQFLNNETAIFQSFMDATFRIYDTEMTFNHLRMMIVLHKIGEEIKIVAKHLSLPTNDHEEGESFPVKEAKTRSKNFVDTIEIRF